MKAPCANVKDFVAPSSQHCTGFHIYPSRVNSESTGE